MLANNPHRLLIVASLLLGLLPWAHGRDYRLVSSNGVPRILEDGVAISTRMFYGYTSATRSGFVNVGAAWQKIEVEITAPESDPQAHLHFRLGEEAGSLFLDDVSLTDLTTGEQILSDSFENGGELPGKWRDWKSEASAPASLSRSAGPEGTSLEIRLGESAPPEPGKAGKTDPRLKGYHVLYGPIALAKDHRYALRMRVRAGGGERRLRVEFKHQGGDFRSYGGMRPPFAEQVRLAGAHGVDFVSFDAPCPWPESGKPVDYASTLRACAEVLAANPKAKLIPRLSMNPPETWRRAHPADLVEYEDGKKSAHASVASMAYGKDAFEALRGVLRAMEKAYGASLAGYHLTGQNTGEWFYPEAWGWRFVGFEEPMREAWRKKGRGPFPEAKDRRGVGPMAFLDPAKDGDRVLFNRFLQDQMADLLLALARVVREETAGKRLVLLFYGYTFEMATYANGPACTGHFALRRLLANPDVDILCGPIGYTDRQAGGGGPCMAAGESLALAGKLWLNEDDTSTWLARPNFFDYPGWKSGPATVEDSLAVVRRNLAQNQIRQFPTWWMDLGATGWWNDGRLWEEQTRLKPALDRSLAAPRPFRPEIALVVDEESSLWMAGNAAARQSMRSLVYESRTNLSRVGAPSGQWLLDDAVGGKAPARLHVVLNAFRLTAAQRKRLASSLAASSVVWCWAPGYLDDAGFSTQATEELTGFKVERMPEDLAAMATATAAGLRLGLPAAFGVRTNVAPLLSPGEGAGDEVWARFPDGRAAVLARALPGNRWALFCSVPDLPTALLREMSRRSGVHLYTGEDAHVWAHEGLVSLHTVKEGPLKLSFPSGAGVRDLVSGEKYPGRELSLNVRAGETRLFQAE